MARSQGPGKTSARTGAPGDPAARQRITPGTVRRILPYARRQRGPVALLLLVTVVHSVILASFPLLLKAIIDEGVLPGRPSAVLWWCAAGAGLAVLDAAALYTQVRCSGRVGEGLVHDLRTTVFAHVQQQSLGFFTRSRTGALMSRVNNDVAGARQALTALLTQSVSTVLTLVLVLAAMFYLSWQIALSALVMIPFFLIPARLLARRLQRLTRESMQLDAEMSSMMSERFNVAGATLTKLYGDPAAESRLFAGKAARVRDVVALRVVYGRMLVVVLTVLTGLTTALVYGLGGSLAIDGKLAFGTLVAMVALLMQAYGPINQLSSLQVTLMTALVSFDRVFEVLDLKPSITEKAGARDLPSTGEPPEITFDNVRFRYPDTDETTLTSLQADTPHTHKKTDTEEAWILDGITFTAPAGKLTAIVGPSGAGKTTLTQLLPRLYDPTHGTVSINGHDTRDLTLTTLRNTIGVVSQDAHLFHDTLRANLTYANPHATEHDLINACRQAHIWNTIHTLPQGLDTIVGDRGHRLSGGEKQRIALARLLLKQPPIVILDEATAHLDTESETAIQHALKTALTHRTSLVIAHRLSTIRHADHILVIADGHIHEQGTHHQLLTHNGLYADLYHTQFAGQPDEADEEPAAATPTA
ncbi:ABC transporter ATP-binding protein [Streptomyces sp. SID7499]|uniref:ABC transporter ATP-binding protein n=1 Tax=Streptomyces sp. SID7499 TaxID=2706086 RepID=A0A6G3XS94_9ACTN|nr:ABC transporter ATP-binding protein [Streptomyces sp. SID7499]